MKSFTFFSFFILFNLTIFVHSTSLLNPSNHQKRTNNIIPGPCRDKYRGNLIVNTGNADRSKYVQLGTIPGPPESIAWFSKTLVQFVFQECQIEGWNAPPQEHGHLIINNEGNSTCLAADTKLYFDNESYRIILSKTQIDSKHPDLLAHQWFYANYLQSPNGSPSIELSLYGNPNDDKGTFQAPHVVLHSDASVAVDNKVTEAYYDRFRLVDVEIVTIKPMVNNKPTTNEDKCKKDLFAGAPVTLSDEAKAQFTALQSSGSN